ncbi:hypothetical protein [Dysosmobacter sp. Phy]
MFLEKELEHGCGENAHCLNKQNSGVGTKKKASKLRGVGGQANVEGGKRS